MARLPEKILKWIEDHDENQAKMARAIGVDESQFAKWLKGRGKPLALQLLAIARYMKVPMEYLADDGMDDVPEQPSTNDKAAVPVMTDDEDRLLWLFRRLGITTDEAVRRLAGEPASTAGGVARPMNPRDESEAAKRSKEEKRRLGFELEGEAERSDGNDSPPRRRH